MGVDLEVAVLMCDSYLIVKPFNPNVYKVTIPYPFYEDKLVAKHPIEMN